jgi:hypothetical protein
LANKEKHSDAVMTGVPVAKFKMRQIGDDLLEETSVDATSPEFCSAAKKVLDAIPDSPDLLLRLHSLATKSLASKIRI